MIRFWKWLKDFFDYIGNNLKNTFIKIFSVLKVFYGSWRNWLMTFAFIMAIVFISLWNVALWCRLAGLGSLTVGLGLLGWYFTIFYINFVQIIEAQKREILENLATQFVKKEYLELKTPFGEKDENVIKEKIKHYRNVMIVCWLLFAVSLFFLITMLF